LLVVGLVVDTHLVVAVLAASLLVQGLLLHPALLTQLLLAQVVLVAPLTMVFKAVTQYLTVSLLLAVVVELLAAANLAL
jgi:hypothetical protein